MPWKPNDDKDPKINLVKWFSHIDWHFIHWSNRFFFFFAFCQRNDIRHLADIADVLTSVRSMWISFCADWHIVRCHATKKNAIESAWQEAIQQEKRDREQFSFADFTVDSMVPVLIRWERLKFCAHHNEGRPKWKRTARWLQKIRWFTHWRGLSKRNDRAIGTTRNQKRKFENAFDRLKRVIVCKWPGFPHTKHWFTPDTRALTALNKSFLLFFCFRSLMNSSPLLAAVQLSDSKLILVHFARLIRLSRNEFKVKEIFDLSSTAGTRNDKKKWSERIEKQTNEIRQCLFLTWNVNGNPLLIPNINANRCSPQTENKIEATNLLLATD